MSWHTSQHAAGGLRIAENRETARIKIVGQTKIPKDEGIGTLAENLQYCVSPWAVPRAARVYRQDVRLPHSYWLEASPTDDLITQSQVTSVNAFTPQSCSISTDRALLLSIQLTAADIAPGKMDTAHRARKNHPGTQGFG